MKSSGWTGGVFWRLNGWIELIDCGNGRHFFTLELERVSPGRAVSLHGMEKMKRGIG